jgi:protein-tyrosine kinase
LVLTVFFVAKIG